MSETVYRTASVDGSGDGETDDDRSRERDHHERRDHDPEFLADAAKTKIDVSPMTGAEVEAFIAEVSRATPAVIERAKQAFAP